MTAKPAVVATGSPRRLYAIYTRESTRAQLEGKSYDSHASQTDYLRAWVEREGGTVYRVYSDTESGTTHERDGLMELFADAQAGKFQVAAAYDLDRWARNIEVHVLMKQVGRKAGVKFVSATQPFTDDAEGRLMELQIAGFAQFYSDTISKKVRIKRKLMAKEGQWLGGRPPFGYQAVDKKLVPHAEESAIVRLLFRLYLEHSSVAAVRHRLKAQGIRNRRGREWSTSSIEGVLQRRVYIGEVQNAGDFFKGRHEPIVEPALFAAAQKALPTKRRLRPLCERPFPLVGVLRCGACDSAMTLHYAQKKTGHRVGYYRCTSTFQRGWSACAVKQVNANRIEQWVADLIKELGATPSLVEEAVRSSNADHVERLKPLREKERTLVARQREIGEGLKTLVEVLKTRGAGSFASIQEGLASGERDRSLVESELGLLREEIARLDGGTVEVGRLRKAVHDFHLLYEMATPAERQELVQLLFKKIEFHGAGNPVTVELYDGAGVNLESSKLHTVWLR